jgi:hypothetical protein
MANGLAYINQNSSAGGVGQYEVLGKENML